MTSPSKLAESAQAILDWCQEIQSLDVRANAEAAKTLPIFPLVLGTAGFAGLSAFPIPV